MKRFLSLGAGVQSSVILLMSEQGELPKLDAAIFADTHDEPDAVYEWLTWLQEQCSTPIIVCGRDIEIAEDVTGRVRDGRRLDKPPFFTKAADGKYSICNRDCTREWKVKQIEKATRKLIGLKPKQRWPKSLTVETWIGISWDEKQRAKVATQSWQRFWHPLIEQPWTSDTHPMWLQRPFTRLMCLDWMRGKGLPEPPRSACWHCPFRSNEHWRILRDNEPDKWHQAIEFDRELRANGNIHGMRQEVYLHRSLKPLDEAPIEETNGTLFDNECAGVCGV
ncbi:MAG: hypothetical protein ACPGPS_04010 [Rubripirellula sp.]